MKIAVVTDDHQKISAHFGRAAFYEVFTITDGKITERESLPKPSHDLFASGPHDEPGTAHGFGPHATDRHMRMLEPIRDCQVLLSRGMGQGAHDSLEQAGIHAMVTDIPDIETAVKAYLEGRLEDHPERLH